MFVSNKDYEAVSVIGSSANGSPQVKQVLDAKEHKVGKNKMVSLIQETKWQVMHYGGKMRPEQQDAYESLKKQVVRVREHHSVRPAEVI